MGIMRVKTIEFPKMFNKPRAYIQHYEFSSCAAIIIPNNFYNYKNTWKDEVISETISWSKLLKNGDLPTEIDHVRSSEIVVACVVTEIDFPLRIISHFMVWIMWDLPFVVNIWQTQIELDHYREPTGLLMTRVGLN